ncbi:hypothetical protein ACFU3O_33965 [Streptomyces antibioticus]|uniref:hypothetical protein n=1 Tax=Streptomyces antibioticus TaxID=1890 RepID=UPI0036766B97
MNEPLDELIAKLRRHHGIYVMRRTFEGTCAFLSGYDLGSGRNFLREFHGWLLLRGKGRPELYWPMLVLCEVYPDGSLPDIRCFTPEQDEQMVTVLFDLFEEFLRV